MRPKFPVAALGLIILAGLLTGCASSTNTDLARAWHIISSRNFVDLTQTFSPMTPVWEGFGQATFSPAADPATGRVYTIEKDGFRAIQYTLVGEYGTHIDAPAH